MKKDKKTDMLAFINKYNFYDRLYDWPDPEGRVGEKQNMLKCFNNKWIYDKKNLCSGPFFTQGR